MEHIGCWITTYTVPQEDTTYYAAWEKAEATVTFDADGGETVRKSISTEKVLNSVDELEEWDFRTRNHEDMESYNVWMEQLQGRTLYYEEPDYAPTSIITLATCDRRVHEKDGRFLVIVGK